MYCSSFISSYGWNVCGVSRTKGLQYIADKVHASAVTTADALNKLGVYQTNSAFFDTILVKADAKSKAIAENMK